MIKFHCFAISAAIIVSTSLIANTVTWVAVSNDDMEQPSNWSTASVPGMNDNAIFDSSIPSIALTPTEQTAPFHISTIQFPNSASAFTFNFLNQNLTFHGPGITGNETNATFNFSNNNNSNPLTQQLFFAGNTPSTSGSAIINASNTAILPNRSNIANQIISGTLAIDNHGTLTAVNQGIESDMGVGGNVTAGFDTQILFDQVSAGNHVTVSARNSGRYTGSNSTIRNLVGNGFAQIISNGNFQAGDHLHLNAINQGSNNSTGIGNNGIGNISNRQMLFGGTCTVGNEATISISNSGSNSGSGTNSNFVGYLRGSQFDVVEGFYAGDDLNLSVTNVGFDNSTGPGGHLAGVIDLTGQQILFEDLCYVGNRATISALNIGSASSENTVRGPSVGQFNDGGQIFFSGNFLAQDYLNLSATNLGSDGATGPGQDVVGALSGPQIFFNSSAILGDHNAITATNIGIFGGQNTVNYNAIGTVSAPQVYCTEAFQAGEYFQLSVENIGSDSGASTAPNYIGYHLNDQVKFNSTCQLGNHADLTIINLGININNATSYNYIGDIINAGQLHFLDNFTAGTDFKLRVENSGLDSNQNPIHQGLIGYVDQSSVQCDKDCHLGDRAFITLSNQGTYSGSNTSNNSAMGLVQDQLTINGNFSAGNNLSLNATNSGIDESIGQGRDSVGNVIDTQIKFLGRCEVGDDASFVVTNSGNYSGSNSTDIDSIGNIFNIQQRHADILTAGDRFGLSITNSGTCNTTGIGNEVGLVGNFQWFLQGGCKLGDDATILISNKGTNSNTGIFNEVGSVLGNQAFIVGDFVAGNNLNMVVENKSENTGNVNNFVGNVGASQVVFQDSFKIGNGSALSVFNTGQIGRSQIIFNNGFDILSGKATIQAINSGTLGDFGVSIFGNSLGGDANIVLSDSSLNIDTNLPTFTIGELNGDSTSFAQSRPTLIINTDLHTHGNFAGVIQDFPSESSTLVKDGPGSQKLSGENTYTGLTTVKEGSLILTGSLAGDVTIEPAGILKGTGTVGGSVTNMGTISPGESIGTLTFLGNYINLNGNYDVEVNSLGQSDLIDVAGATILAGGNVLVSTVDGSYQFHRRYTIVTSAAVSGNYSGAIAVSPWVVPLLSYDPNHVYLTLGTAIGNAAGPCNQKAIALALDNITDPTDNQNVLLSQIVDLSKSDVQSALENLDGFQHTNDVWMMEMINRKFIRRLYDPLRAIVTLDTDYENAFCGSNSTSLDVWAEIEGGHTKLQGNGCAHGFDMNSYELTAGLQKTFDNSITAGIAGSYEYDKIHYHERGSGNNNAWLAGLYGLYRPKCYYGLFDIVYAHNNHSITRTIDIGALHTRASSKPKISDFAFYGEVGVDWGASCFLIQPFIGIESNTFWRHHVREKEKHGWGLAVGKKSWTTTSSRVGVHLTTNKYAYDLDISLDLAWNRLLSNTKNRIRARFTEFGSGFDIKGINLQRDSVDYALTISKDITPQLNAYLEFNGENWKHVSNYNLVGGIGFNW